MKALIGFMRCVAALLLAGLIPAAGFAEDTNLITADYVIVYPDLAERKEISTAKSLQKALNAAGLNLTLETDWVKPGEEIPAAGYEILIGETNRPESAMALTALKKDDFIISSVGDRIVILGGTPAATVQAVNHFKDNYIREGKCVAPSEPYVSRGTYPTQKLLLNGIDISEYTIITSQLKVTDKQLVDHLVDWIADISGDILPVVDAEDATGPAITIERRSDGSCAIEVTDDGILIRGGGDIELQYALAEFQSPFWRSIDTKESHVVLESKTINPEDRFVAQLNEGDLPVFEQAQADFLKEASQMDHRIIKNALSLSTGERLQMDVGNSKQNNSTTLRCQFDVFPGIRVGHGLYSGWVSSWVDVYPDRIEVWMYNLAPEKMVTYQHGLTLQGDVTLTLTALPNAQAYVLLSSRTGIWQSEPFPFRGCGMTAFAETLDGTAYNIRFSYLDQDKQHDTWLFGDSYMDYFPQHLLSTGFTNFALDGYGGLGVQRALDSLKIALAHWPAPERLIWALGMNNPDENEAINPDYLRITDELITLCTENDIQLILCTIPNVPERDHRYKNAYILQSGCRICDLAGAVQIYGDNHWFPGTIDADQVHPSPMGARLIALRLISEVPEIYDME